MAKTLRAEVIDFLVKQIDSLEELEILLLLAASPESNWTVAQVDSEIRSSAASVTSKLSGLERKTLIARNDNSYHYQPANEQLRSVVDQTAHAYREQRMQVIETIFSKPLATIVTFSDAFTIRRKD